MKNNSVLSHNDGKRFSLKMKKIWVIPVVIFVIGLITLFVWAAVPSINSARIFSTTNGTNAPLLGFCTGLDGDNDTMSYFFEWYKNQTWNRSGHLTNPGITQVSSTVINDSLFGTYSVFVSGDYAYVADDQNDSISIINISSKSLPVTLSILSNGSSMNSARGVFVSGDYAYVTSSTSDSLTIINISSKTSPVQIASLSNSSSMDGTVLL
ncbi:MAG: hypothetical protein AABY22_06320, partial [Nanoarchaeota archaeon]